MPYVTYSETTYALELVLVLGPEGEELEAIFSQHKDDLFYLESIFLEDRAYI
jgi:hypothetical protein